MLHIAVPGAKKEDVGVNWDADKGILSVSGVVYRPGDEAFLQGLVSGERKVGLFSREINLPPPGTEKAEKEDVDSEGITARMEDGVLMLDEAELMDDGDLMLSLEEEAAGGTREFGSVPASESSIKTLDTKTYQGDGQDGSMCSICLENFEAGAEQIVLPCCHEFHCSCATKWLERSHLCPLCRYPMPTVDGEAAIA